MATSSVSYEVLSTQTIEVQFNRGQSRQAFGGFLGTPSMQPYDYKKTITFNRVNSTKGSAEISFSLINEEAKSEVTLKIAIDTIQKVNSVIKGYHVYCTNGSEISQFSVSPTISPNIFQFLLGKESGYFWEKP